MSWLELWEFVLALPSDSMTMAAQSNDLARRRWTERDYMQASSLSLMQQMIQILWASHLQGRPPRSSPWPLPDLRSLAQIEADEALDRLMRTYLQATRPPPPDPDMERLLHERIANRPRNPLAPEPAAGPDN
ncbi:hypothetical protein ACFYXS_02880 [Streptomyces sp. NPDC002574]|uniref:hypothetical protein n=1 Tax=Streptomyces sp. NPDC002574 TaxID=3364652 RepID=UPI0036CC03DC